MAGKPKSSSSVYVFYGAEDYLLDQKVCQAKAAKGRSVVILDGVGMTDVDVVSECEAFSFEDDSRTVVVDNANKVKGYKAIVAYLESKSKDDSTILVLVVRSEKLSAAWTEVAKHGTCKDFPKLRSWDDKKMHTRIKEAAGELHLTLAEGVPRLLIDRLGMDLRLCVNELRKVALITPPGAPVTKDVLQTILPATMVSEPYMVAEESFRRNKRGAVNKLYYLHKHQGDSALVPVTTMLQRKVEELIVARQMLDNGDSNDIIAARLDKHPYTVEKNVLPLARLHTVSQLAKHMQMLCELEGKVKGAARSKRTCVELAVLDICRG